MVASSQGTVGGDVASLAQLYVCMYNIYMYTYIHTYIYQYLVEVRVTLQGALQLLINRYN